MEITTVVRFTEDKTNYTILRLFKDGRRAEEWRNNFIAKAPMSRDDIKLLEFDVDVEIGDEN